MESNIDFEEEKDLENIVNLVLKQAIDFNAQKTSLSAALRLFYSRGYRVGYNEAMKDAKMGKDKRVAAHLN